MGILIRTPSEFIDNRFVIVTAPFHWHVWACAGLLTLLSSFILERLCFITGKYSDEVQYSVVDAVWLFYGIFVQQDLSNMPKSWTLGATFTGKMVAIFAVLRSPLPFTTSQELVEKVRHDVYTIIIQNASNSHLALLNESKESVLQDLWKEMTVKGWMNVDTLQRGMTLVTEHPNLALLGVKESLETLAATNCSVTTLDEAITTFWMSIALRKGSPYNRLFSEVTSIHWIMIFIDLFLFLIMCFALYYKQPTVQKNSMK